MRWTHRTARSLLVCLLTLGALGAPRPALAHANLVEAAPAPGALDALPEQLTLAFSEGLGPGSAAPLLDASGAAVPGATSQIDPDDQARLVVAVPPLAAGAYNVAWTSVSAADGHEQRGLYALLAGGALPPAGAAPPVRDPAAVPAGLDVRLTAVPDAGGVLQWRAGVAGPGAANVQRVSLRFTPPRPELGVEQVVAEWDDGAGAYAVAQPLALAGTWTVEVLVRRAGVADDVRVPFAWTAA
jgi:methionine-rich copper-binding protein CopC